MQKREVWQLGWFASRAETAGLAVEQVSYQAISAQVARRPSGEKQLPRGTQEQQFSKHSFRLMGKTSGRGLISFPPVNSKLIGATHAMSRGARDCERWLWRWR